MGAITLSVFFARIFLDSTANCTVSQKTLFTQRSETDERLFLAGVEPKKRVKTRKSIPVSGSLPFYSGKNSIRETFGSLKNENRL